MLATNQFLSRVLNIFLDARCQVVFEMVVEQSEGFTELSSWVYEVKCMSTRFQAWSFLGTVCAPVEDFPCGPRNRGSWQKVVHRVFGVLKSDISVRFSLRLSQILVVGQDSCIKHCSQQDPRHQAFVPRVKKWGRRKIVNSLESCGQLLKPDVACGCICTKL